MGLSLLRNYAHGFRPITRCARISIGSLPVGMTKLAKTWVHSARICEIWASLSRSASGVPPTSISIRFSTEPYIAVPKVVLLSTTSSPASERVLHRAARSPWDQCGGVRSG